MQNEYTELINKLVESFKVDIPEKEKDIVKEFENYLYMKLNTLEKLDSLNNKNKESIERTLIYITEKIKQMDLESKKKEIIVDKSFEKIKNISKKIFELAQEVLAEKCEEPDFEKLKIYVENMKNELDNVKEFNRKQAEFLLSEGVLDDEFIKNPTISITSLRLKNRVK